MIKTETTSDVMLRALRNLIANDSFAMSFQSMGQYRIALLRHSNDLAAAALAGKMPEACAPMPALMDIATWQQRMPAPRPAYQCTMNCSSVGMSTVREEGCGDCMPIIIHGDPVAARDAEIADLRATVAASARQSSQAEPGAWSPCQVRAIEAYMALQSPRAAADASGLLPALRGEMPLTEPVHIGKALRAGREARAVLSGGTGPLACVMLVNIQLTPWIHTEETAKAFAAGYNKGLDHLRGAVLAVAEQDRATDISAGGQS